MSTQKGTLINKYTPDYVIFDLETTGISPNYDEVIEISALKVKGGEVVDEFNTLVNPGRKIPFGATKVNGITNAMVAEAPAFSHVLAEFLDFAEGLVLVGHNIARFDMKFIWRDAEQYFGEFQAEQLCGIRCRWRENIYRRWIIIVWWIWRSIMVFHRKVRIEH